MNFENLSLFTAEKEKDEEILRKQREQLILLMGRFKIAIHLGKKRRRKVAMKFLFELPRQSINSTGSATLFYGRSDSKYFRQSKRGKINDIMQVFI